RMEVISLPRGLVDHVVAEIECTIISKALRLQASGDKARLLSRQHVLSGPKTRRHLEDIYSMEKLYIVAQEIPVDQRVEHLALDRIGGVSGGALRPPEEAERRALIRRIRVNDDRLGAKRACTDQKSFGHCAVVRRIRIERRIVVESPVVTGPACREPIVRHALVRRKTHRAVGP